MEPAAREQVSCFDDTMAGWFLAKQRKYLQLSFSGGYLGLGADIATAAIVVWEPQQQQQGFTPAYLSIGEHSQESSKMGLGALFNQPFALFLTHKHDRVGALAIPSRPARFLQEGFHIGAEIQVYDRADITFINTQSIRASRTEYGVAVVEKPTFRGLAFNFLQSCVVVADIRVV